MNTCLKWLTALAEAGTRIAAPLMLGDEGPVRLAFPVRLAGMSRPDMPLNDADEERADG